MMSLLDLIKDSTFNLPRSGKPAVAALVIGMGMLGAGISTYCHSTQKAEECKEECLGWIEWAREAASLEEAKNLADHIPDKYLVKAVVNKLAPTYSSKAGRRLRNELGVKIKKALDSYRRVLRINLEGAKQSVERTPPEYKKCVADYKKAVRAAQDGLLVGVAGGVLAATASMLLGGLSALEEEDEY